MAMILRLLLVTLEEEDNLRIYDSIFWLSLIKCSYIPSPLPVLGNDGAGECRRLLHRIKMVLFREPLTCARSSFCWNHLSVPALLFVWTTYICQICFFLQPFACVNTISFLKPLLVQIPNFVGLLSSLLFQNLFYWKQSFSFGKTLQLGTNVIGRIQDWFETLRQNVMLERAISPFDIGLIKNIIFYWLHFLW